MADQDKLQITINYKYYLQYLDWANSVDGANVEKFVGEAQDFYNGKQYPNVNYNNMIRVTLNICSFAADIKTAKVCGTPIYITYTSDNPDIDCTKLRQFDEYNCNKLGLKESNYYAALNGFVNGTEITYIRWDDDDTSYKGIYKGGLVEEHIDMRNFAVANPKKVGNIQNQEWVMFWQNVPCGVIKNMLEGDKKTIEEKKKKIYREVGGGSFVNENMDRISQSYCVLYTRFFRIDGEVYFMCSTQYVDVFEYPHPLSKKISKRAVEKIVDEYRKNLDTDKENPDNNLVSDYRIDYEDVVMSSYGRDVLTDDEYKGIKEKFSLYPFATYIPFKRNDSFFGKSDTKALIPIQRGINFMYSMLLKCAENNAYNKIFVKPDTLQGQVITNEPNQILVDYSGFTNGWGMKMAETQPMPNGLLDFSERLLASTRVVYGFNDVMDGSISNQDMSGYMLQQMIKQSNTSIEQQQQLFWAYNEDKAAIRLMYYKHYVDKAKYTIEMDDVTYEGEEQARKTLLSATLNGVQLPDYPEARAEDFMTPTHKVKTKEITNEELYGINFDISIEAMQGLSDSKLVEQQMWDNLLLNGGIQNIEPEILEMYLEASPNVSARTKTALKGVVENLKRGKINQLEQQLSQLSQQTEQIISYAKQLEAKLGYTSEYTKNLQAEFTNKINQSNKINTALMKDLDNYKQTANKGEVKSNNSRGISGTKTNETVV